MRIARITAAVLEANRDWAIVRVERDDGGHGWGESFRARERLRHAPEGPGIGADLDLEVARRYARPGSSCFGSSEVP